MTKCDKTAQLGDNRHAAIVLAAGRSERLGFPKQWLTIRREPLIIRSVRLAALTLPARLLLVVEAVDPRLQQAVDAYGVELVTNPRAASGIASSLQRAVQVLDLFPYSSLIVGCDQPALQLDHLNQLLAAASTSSSGCAATRHGGNYGIPVVASASFVRKIFTLNSDRGLSSFFSDISVESFGVIQDPRLSFDLDAPGDVLSARQCGLLD